MRKPSRRSSIMACRTGWRLTPNFWANSSWVIRVPALSSPEQIASRTASWTRSERSGSGRKALIAARYTEHRRAGVNELARFQAFFRQDRQSLLGIVGDQPIDFAVDQPRHLGRLVDRPRDDLEAEF